MFNSRCTKCGSQMQVPSAYRDKTVQCLACREYFVATPAEQLPFEFPCPTCNSSIEAERGWAGMHCPCPICKLTIQIPEPPFYKPPGIETTKIEDELDAASANLPPPPRVATASSSDLKFLYICRNGQNVEGPLPADQVCRMSQRNEIDASVMVSVAGTDKWTPLDRMPDTIYSKAFQTELCEKREALAQIKKTTEDIANNLKVWGPIIIIGSIILGILLLIQYFQAMQSLNGLK